MAMTDNKTFGWNISITQAVSVLVIAVLVALTIATGNLAIGYIVMTLALSVFFVVVAFDIGLPSKGRGQDV